MSVYELTDKEIYDAYAHGRDPNEILREDQAQIATRLRVEENMDENAAYYAADELLQYAQKIVDGMRRRR